MRICLFSILDALCHTPSLPFGELEQNRLAAIRHPDRQKESLCALLALRELVGDFPLTIMRAPEGKPYFDDPSAPPFSLCHTKAWAAAVLGDDHSGKVGIDLEPLRPYPHAKSVAHRFFTPEEYAEFSAMDENELAFFCIWTKKEALAKMSGTGLLAKEQSKPSFSTSFQLTSESESLILTVSAENAIPSISWHSPSKEFYHFDIKELR